MVSERSIGTLLLACVAVGLLGFSLVEPWFGYYHSSGRQAPYGGFQDPEEDGVERQRMTARPGETSGDIEPEDSAAAAQTLDWMQWGLYAALGLLVLVLLGEIPGVDRIITRRVSLGLHVAAFLSVCAVLWLIWFRFPEQMGYGVTWPYTSDLDGDGYTVTTLKAGFVLAALSTGALFGGFLFKFQAGAPDPTVVVDLAAEEASA